MGLQTLSKTTMNFAEARGLHILIANENEFIEQSHISITSANEESDAELNYMVEWTPDNPSEGYSYWTNTWLSNSVIEELPAYIRDEKHLREVLSFISSQLNG